MDIIDAANKLNELHGAFCSRECGEDYERDRRRDGTKIQPDIS